MSRSPEKNAEVREKRKKQILDAALTVYIRFGFYGADVDFVAEEAKLAKGLVYYYFKTKKELFTELYTWMFNESYSFSESLLRNSINMNPVEQLMAYTYEMFMANSDNPRLMQFAIRVPFDAYAVFGPEQWKDGARKSDLHRKALADIVKNGIDAGLIPKLNPDAAANSFWSVFVANVFDYSKLITATQTPAKNDMGIFKDTVRFCFQGLGIEHGVWNACLEKIFLNRKKGAAINEGI